MCAESEGSRGSNEGEIVGLEVAEKLPIDEHQDARKSSVSKFVILSGPPLIPSLPPSLFLVFVLAQTVLHLYNDWWMCS